MTSLDCEVDPQAVRLDRVICLIEPDSSHVVSIFGDPHNARQLVPRASDATEVISPTLPNSRESTPLATEPLQKPVLAFTTYFKRLQCPGEGLVFGSDKRQCDILLDDSKSRGVGARQFRLYFDLDRPDQQSLVVQNLSTNKLELLSRQPESNIRLAKHDQSIITGGTWTIRLMVAVRISLRIIFPAHTGCVLQLYNEQWATFIQALTSARSGLDRPWAPTSSNPVSAPIETPAVNEGLGKGYTINWSPAGLLGRGAFGEVRRAVASLTGDVVVAKVFTASHQSHVQMHKKEFELLQVLRNKHIVKCQDLISVNGRNALIMEYLPGGNLAEKLAAVPKTEALSQARLYWQQLASGLDFLHREKVLHRDIKPANILLNGSGTRVKLCDFGLAKLLKVEDFTTSQQGTPHYTAPEIFFQHRYSYPSDVWALGTTILEMYRQLPEKGSGWIIAGPNDDKQCQAWYANIKQRVIDLPPDLVILQRYMEEEPGNRCTTHDMIQWFKQMNAELQPRKQRRSSVGGSDDQQRDVQRRKKL